MLLIVVIVGVVVCVFLGHFAFSYHKQEKTVRSKGGITAMFSEVIKGLLEYRSARVVQQSNSFIGISGFFYDPITSRECGNWGFKLQISFQLLVVQYRAYVDLGGGEHIKQNWDFPITLSQSEIVNILKKKADETNVYGIFKYLKSATYRVSWEFTCKTTKILLLYIFLGHNRNFVNTKFPYPIKRLEVIRRFNQKSIAFNQSLS